MSKGGGSAASGSGDSGGSGGLVGPGGSYGGCEENSKKRCIILSCCAILCLLIVIIVVAGIFVLKPSKPRFALVGATLNSFNRCSPGQVSSNTSFPINIRARNPNRRTRFYYSSMETYATFQDQQITNPTSIPPTFQDTKETTVWSPLLQEQCVSIPQLDQIVHDHQSEILELEIKMIGRLKWKLVSFIGGHYHFYVNCPAILQWNPNTKIWETNIGIATNLPNQGCSVIKLN